MQPSLKNKFFRLPGSYIYIPLALVPLALVLVLVPGSFGPTLALSRPGLTIIDD